VSELVQRLDHRIDQPEQQQVLGREQAIGHVLGEVGPVRRRQHHAGADHAEPESRAEPAEEPPREGQRALEEAVRVEQRKAQRERRPQAAAPLHAFVPLVPPEHLTAVGRDVAEQRVGRVQLPEQADHFFLRRRAVAELLGRRLPDFLHRAVAVHQADEIVRGRRKAVRAPGGMILQHEPHLAAVGVPVDRGVRADARLERRDAVPRRAEKRVAHEV
jgi:hypothetical protein